MGAVAATSDGIKPVCKQEKKPVNNSSKSTGQGHDGPEVARSRCVRDGAGPLAGWLWASYLINTKIACFAGLLIN